MKYPTTIGGCIDALYKLRKQRLNIEKEAEAVRKKENALENYILETFKKSDLDGARGKLAVVGITKSIVPVVNDWNKLYEYIKEKDAWDLLQKRVSTTAYRERLDANEGVSGVEAFVVTKLSLRKR